MKKLIGIACVLIAMTGCTTQKVWTASDGSRSDVIIRLSYEEGSLQRAQMSEQQGIDLAAKKCHAWGYNGAEAFGGATRTCNARNQYGCLKERVTKIFQCTGKAN